MEKLKHVILVIFLFGFTLYLTSPAWAAKGLDPAPDDKEPIATMQLSTDQVQWWPNKDYPQLVLTISGQGEAYFSQEFGPDSIPIFELLDNTGNKFPDGSCTYELKANPLIAPKSRVMSDLPNEILPKMPLLQSGHFSIYGGKVVTYEVGEEEAYRDVLHYDDVIITGSLCTGFDCANGESFGYCTLKLKENNLQICFEDTSVGSFPTNDWKIQINDTTSGGASYFTLWDTNGGRRPFTIEAGAPAHSLYVEDYGRVGLGTSIPYVELHIVDGDSPTIRLDQDGSSGWTAQRWDICGNETNFFVRDVTNGSKLTFRIQPNTPSNTLCMRSTGYVGIGTWSPAAKLHVQDSDGDASLFVEETSSTGAARKLMHLKNNGGVQFDFENTATSSTWRFVNSGNPSTLVITELDQSGAQLTIDKDGDLHVQGDIYSGGTQLNVPDYVFESDYPLMSLNELDRFIAENKHLPNMPSKTDVDQEQSLNLTQLQMKLLEKIEELTLYTLTQQKVINSQQETIDKLNARLTAMEQAQ